MLYGSNRLKVSVVYGISVLYVHYCYCKSYKTKHGDKNKKNVIKRERLYDYDVYNSDSVVVGLTHRWLWGMRKRKVFNKQ